MAKVETKKIDDLLPDPNNVNRHTQKGHGLVENSIRRRGIGRGILAAGKNTEKPVIMAGNLTHEKARDAGIDEVVFVHTTGNQLVVTVRDDLDPTSPEAIALGIEDNESGKLSYNPDIDLLAAMSAGDNGVLSKLKEDDKIFGDMLAGMGVKDGEPVDAEPQIDRAAELAEKWQTKSGQLWKLGEHRLLIGDCTVRENVERLMGGERAVVMFTDPPYSFETDGGWFNGKRPKVMDDIKENGTNIFDPLPFLATLKDVFPSGYHSSFIFCNKALIHQYLGFAVENGFSYNILVWKKQNVVPFGDSHFPDVEYLIFIRKGAKWNNGTDANRSKVLIYDQDFEMQKDHPTPKPLKLVENELILTTGVGDCIYEPFAGSGTTIIAAHNLNRRCFAMEISEKYGAVILERFFEATGIMPELVTE